MCAHIKYLTLVSILCICFGIVSIAQTSFISPDDSTKWKLSFSDEFNGEKLDKSLWRTAKGMSRDYDFKSQKNWLTKDNIVMEDGLMKMMVKKEKITGSFTIDWSTTPSTKKTADFDYSAAEIISKGEYGYGKYEIRCKIPKGKGMWPAFWMYGESEFGKINSEIDVFEFWHPKTGLRKYVPRLLSRVHHMTLHHDGKMSHYKKKGVDFSLDFHDFMVVYTPDYIEWYVDGELQRRYDFLHDKELKGLFKRARGKHQGNVFPDVKMRIIIDVAVQNKEKAPDENNVFPQALEVDYVRYYEIVD